MLVAWQLKQLALLRQANEHLVVTALRAQDIADTAAQALDGSRDQAARDTVKLCEERGALRHRRKQVAVQVSPYSSANRISSALRLIFTFS